MDQSHSVIIIMPSAPEDGCMVTMEGVSLCGLNGLKVWFSVREEGVVPGQGRAGHKVTPTLHQTMSWNVSVIIQIN